MKKIVGFGDSFVFGTELQNNSDGSKSWPALAAKKLGVDYETTAVAGCGNDHIARQIYTYFSNNSAENTLAVINWTWMSRWDFYIVEHETWITLGPTCVPEKLKNLVDQTQAHDMIDFYKQRANSSLLWNKFRNLQTIYAVQNYLKHRNILNIQTYMDYELFDQQWHAPDYIKELQSLVQPPMQNFHGKNFVDWSRDRGFAVTDIGMHPLEQAHVESCTLWTDVYAQLLKT
jgi:hypothetical protein